MWFRYIVFWVLTFSIPFMANSYIENSIMYRSKAGKIDFHYQQINSLNDTHEKTLIIGNSYVNASFRPQKSDKQFYKLIVSGMPLDDIVSIVETLPPNTDFKNIVIGLGYNYATPIVSRSYIYRQYSADNELSKLWWSIPLVRGNSLISTSLKEDVKCLFEFKKANRCDVRLNNIGLDNVDEDLAAEEAADDLGNTLQYDEKERMMRSVNRRFEQYVPYTLDISKLFRAKLTRIKEICAQRDINIYAYTAPIVKDLRVRLNEDVLQRFRSTLEDVGIPYVDLNIIFPDWDHSYFHDATHVTAETGGLKTTEYLIDFINDDISKANPNEYGISN